MKEVRCANSSPRLLGVLLALALCVATGPKCSESLRIISDDRKALQTLKARPETVSGSTAATAMAAGAPLPMAGPILLPSLGTPASQLRWSALAASQASLLSSLNPNLPQQQQQHGAHVHIVKGARLLRQDTTDPAGGVVPVVPPAPGGPELSAAEPVAFTVVQSPPPAAAMDPQPGTNIASGKSDPLGSSSSSDQQSAASNDMAGWPVRRGVLPSITRSGSSQNITLNIQYALDPRLADNQRLSLPQPLFAYRRATLEVVALTPTGVGGLACRKEGLFYSNTQVACNNVPDGMYQLTLTDKDDYTIQVISGGDVISVNSSSSSSPQVFSVIVGVRAVMAATVFEKISWSPNPVADSGSSSTTVYPIGNAALDVYTRMDTSPWITNSTSTTSGTVPIYLPTAAGDAFFANFSFDGTQLTSMGPFGASAADPTKQSDKNSAATSQAVPGIHVDLLLVSKRNFLCTGQFYPVRGDGGTFPLLPVNNTFYPKSNQFACSWVLQPSTQQIDLSINYTMMLPGEQLWVFPSLNSQPLLLLPGDPNPVIDRSISIDALGVRFQFVPNTTNNFSVGGFQVTFKAYDSWGSSLLSSRMLMIVLSLIVGLATLLVACCVCCACINRRYRAQVQVDAAGSPAPNAVAQGLTRVPTHVRELLPLKPYVSPDAKNPLPGAPVEPDCCSICLVEFEAGENVTVLPCRHFYHAPCIDSWLKRRCTCPLCKANVLEGLQPAAATGSGPAAGAPGVGDALVQVEVVPNPLQARGARGAPVASVPSLLPSQTRQVTPAVGVRQAPAAAGAAGGEGTMAVLPTAPVVQGSRPITAGLRHSSSHQMEEMHLPGAVIERRSSSSNLDAVGQHSSREGSSGGHLSDAVMAPAVHMQTGASTAGPPPSAPPAPPEMLQQGYAPASASDFFAAAAAAQEALAAAAPAEGEQQTGAAGQPAPSRAAAVLRPLSGLQQALRAPSQQMLAAGQRLRTALRPSSANVGGGAGVELGGVTRSSPSAAAAAAPAETPRGRPGSLTRSNQVVPMQVGPTVLPVYAYAGTVEQTASQDHTHTQVLRYSSTDSS